MIRYYDNYNDTSKGYHTKSYRESKVFSRIAFMLVVVSWFAFMTVLALSVL